MQETTNEQIYITYYNSVDEFIETYNKLKFEHPEYTNFRLEAEQGQYDEYPSVCLTYKRPLYKKEIEADKKRKEFCEAQEIKQAQDLLRSKGLL